MHLADPTGDVKPFGQLLHELAPELEKVLEGQLVHEVAPALLYVPARQFEHEPLF